MTVARTISKEKIQRPVASPGFWSRRGTAVDSYFCGFVRAFFGGFNMRKKTGLLYSIILLFTLYFI